MIRIASSINNTAVARDAIILSGGNSYMGVSVVNLRRGMMIITRTRTAKIYPFGVRGYLFICVSSFIAIYLFHGLSKLDAVSWYMFLDRCYNDI